MQLRLSQPVDDDIRHELTGGNCMEAVVRSRREFAILVLLRSARLRARPEGNMTRISRRRSPSYRHPFRVALQPPVSGKFDVKLASAGIRGERTKASADACHIVGHGL